MTSDFTKSGEGVVEVWLHPHDGKAKSVFARRVSTPQELRRGLMFRRKLAPDEGMLFEFPDRKTHAMWMRNTFLPLDMIFIDGDLKDGFKVVGVIPEVKPLSEEPRKVDARSTHVLEVRGGFAKRYGIGPGSIVRFGSRQGGK